MKKIIIVVVLSNLLTGCAFWPSVIDNYSGSDAATIIINDVGGNHLINTYIQENGCYKKIESKALHKPNSTFNSPSFMTLEYKIKPGLHYAIVSYSASLAYSRKYEIQSIGVYGFIPEANHTYEFGSYPIKDLTTDKKAIGWPVGERCKNILGGHW